MLGINYRPEPHSFRNRIVYILTTIIEIVESIFEVSTLCYLEISVGVMFMNKFWKNESYD